jgi:glycosyltransferase involved in cell wall biosynthesis
MKKVKIAHILNSVGGVDVSLRLILKNIDSEKFENIVIHGKKDTSKAFENKVGDIVKSYKLNIFRNINFFNDFSALYQSYRILKKESPHLIHAHSAKGGVLGRLLGVLLNIPVFYTPQAFSYLSTQNKIKQKIYLLIERILINKNNYIIASSKSEMNRAILEVKYPEGNVFLFNNCINPIELNTTEENKYNLPRKFISTIGRPCYQKNIELMIDVFAEVVKSTDCHLVIMGVGLHSDHLESVKNKINLKNLNRQVTLIDWIDRDNALKILTKSYIYISTARYEGLPFSIIEAMALKKALVVSDCDGNRDLVKENKNGFIIKNENVTDFKEKIIDLLLNNEKRELFEQESYNLYQFNFNIEKKIIHLENIYNKVLAKK